ncbi:MAG: alpha-amylase family glycosyl hydrolase [Anaerolineae bacterium]|jgi:glycosidase|nr:alpha-amylase family glycosyl hydrolase [Anaerolineae bacterium]
MTPWSNNPRIYEINTRVWLHSLSQQYGEDITLNNVPEAVLDDLAAWQVEAIWLMGVWHRGPATRASALNYIHEYRAVLPDIAQEDVIGSAYAIHDYAVDPALGGRRALATFRRQLQRRGLKLITDFVPNHVAVDHADVSDHPDYFILGNTHLLHHDPTNFFSARTRSGQELVVAHGRDPYFPGWVDTAQLNAFSPGYRAAALNTLKDIARQCDGVRCDMAMLMLNSVFSRTWGWIGVQPPGEEFWTCIIPQVKAEYPDFLFIAEAYWSMEYTLQMQGFDYTYDKVMYDRLVKGDVNGLYLHMGADLSYLKRNIRFIENHDEPRAATAFGIERSRVAATLICTMPGAVLLHEGQFTGRKARLPVQITRQPYETEHTALREFYQKLLAETADGLYRTGTWSLLRCYLGDAGHEGAGNLIAFGWHNAEQCRLVVMNTSEQWSQGWIDLSAWADRLKGKTWLLYDVMHNQYSEEIGDHLVAEGLRVDMEAYQSSIYHFLAVKAGAARKTRVKA